MIYPATDKDFEEFVDEPLRMVKENPELYKTTVLPYFKTVSDDKVFYNKYLLFVHFVIV